MKMLIEIEHDGTFTFENVEDAIELYNKIDSVGNIKLIEIPTDEEIEEYADRDIYLLSDDIKRVLQHFIGAR